MMVVMKCCQCLLLSLQSLVTNGVASFTFTVVVIVVVVVQPHHNKTFAALHSCLRSY